eukprot:Pgem_evm1s6114
MCKNSPLSVDLKVRIGKALGIAYDSGLALELIGQLESGSKSEKDFLSKASQVLVYASGKSNFIEDAKALYQDAINSAQVDSHMVDDFLETDFQLKRRASESGSSSEEDDEGVYFNNKRFRRTTPLKMNRRKSVSFNDRNLEKICEIPSKEITWPYGSLYGDATPRVFTEFSNLYQYDTYKKNEYKNEDTFDPTTFDKEKSLGKGLLLDCGRIAKVVSATSTHMCAKMFVSFSNINEKLCKTQQQYNLRPNDYIETDTYETIDLNNVVAQVNITCVDSKDNDNNNDDKNIKQFHYAWYFNSIRERLVPYPLVGRSVRVYWPEDKQHYLAKIASISKDDGKFCLEYDIDNSLEYLNI